MSLTKVSSNSHVCGVDVELIREWDLIRSAADIVISFNYLLIIFIIYSLQVDSLERNP